MDLGRLAIRSLGEKRLTTTDRMSEPNHAMIDKLDPRIADTPSTPLQQTQPLSPR